MCIALRNQSSFTAWFPISIFAIGAVLVSSIFINFAGMELIIENIKSVADQKLITDLATRLGLKVHTYTTKQEDVTLGKAMKKAEKGKMFSKKEALKFLGND